MTVDDLPLGMRLRGQAGFNQTEADWRRFLDLEPDGCFVAELDGEPVGTVANFVFGPIGWIAMLLVDERFRRRGIGTRLTQHALDHLLLAAPATQENAKTRSHGADMLHRKTPRSRGVATARLDATPRGRLVYKKLGFVAEYELVRLEGTAPGIATPGTVASLTPDRLDALVALDEQATATPRRRLIERLCGERPEATWVFPAGDAIVGYVTLRAGTHATQIGPCVALSNEAGRALGDAALAFCAGQRVFVDVPVDNRPAMQWAESKGLVVQRPFTRMRRGEPVADQPLRLWASSGPEKG